MKQYINKLINTDNKTYLACVRRVPTQFQTIDVEIISDVFDINNPIENFFIYDVQLASVVLLYTSNTTINRPKVNSYVIITQTDTGIWWVIVYGERELYTLTSNDIYINFGKETIIRNSDIISIKNEFKLGTYQSNNEELNIKASSILLQIKDDILYNYIKLDDKIDINSIDKGIYISQMEYIDTQNIDELYHTQSLLEQIILQNTFITSLAKFDDTTTRMYYYGIYYMYWNFIHNLDPYNDINDLTKINIFLNTINYDEMFIFFNNLFNYNGNLYSYLISLTNNSRYIAIITKNFSNVSLDRYIYSFILNEQYTEWHNFINKVENNIGSNTVQAYIFNFNVLYCGTVLSRAINSVLSIMYDKDSEYVTFNELIQLLLNEYPDYEDIIYNNLYDAFSLDMYVTDINDILLYLHTKLEIINLIIDDKKVNADIQDNNTILNLGNIFDDIINSLQNYSVIVTNTSIPATAPGYVVTGYYSNTKILSNKLLPIL